MTTPTVTETFIALEPVTRDDFADSLPSARQFEPADPARPRHPLAAAVPEARR